MMPPPRGGELAGAIAMLKKKVMFFAVILVLGFAVAWLLSDPIIFRIKKDLLPERATLIATTPLEVVMVKIQISVVLAALFLLPFILQTILSNLRLKTRFRVTSIFVWGCAAVLLFLIGFSFTYFFLLPVAITVLTSFTAQADILPLFSINQFVFFAVVTTLIFSLVFELPLVITWLAINNLVQIETLKEKRRFVYVLVVIVAAVITADPTPVSQCLLSVPLIFLYEMSILSASIIVRKRS